MRQLERQDRRRITPSLPHLLAAVLGLALLAGCGGGEDDEAGRPAAFGYGEANGPSRWGSLDPEYAACSDGKRQSPIDLSGGKPAELPELDFSYEPARLEVENNGHSLEAEYPAGSSVRIDGTEYELDQFHSHAPSEHELNGRSFPIELHFVNKADDGSVAVIGVLVRQGDRNTAFSKLVRALPRQEGESLPVPGDVNALDLLPPNSDSAPRWSYGGSLTTPPCTEGVRWEVFQRTIELSANQIGRYTAIYEGTNRPVQPLNGRELLHGR